MRILICRSNPVAPDPRVEKEARALMEAGHTLQVLAWDRTARLPSQEKQDGMTIRRLAIRAEFGQGLGNLPALLRWQWGMAKWLIQNTRQYDVLHACDFDTVLPCIMMKLFWGKPLVYDIFDFYAEHLRRTPERVKSIIRSIDFKAIEYADAVILVDESRREQIKGTNPGRLYIVYNSPEDMQYQKQDFIPSPKGKLILTYVGLLQYERGLLETLNVIKKYPDWTLEMAGFGGDENAISILCRDILNVNLYGRISYDKALEMTLKADVLFATYDPSIPNHRYSSPNKLFEAMMVGKPIIVARDTNMDRIVSEHDCGIVVTYGNETELEEALLKLANDPTLRKRLGRNARKAYETNYSWNIMKSRLIELYSQVHIPNA